MAAYFRLVNAASYTIRTPKKLYTFRGVNPVTVLDPDDVAILRGKPDTVEECDVKGRPLLDNTVPAQSKAFTKEAMSYTKLPKKKKPEAAPAPAPVAPPPPAPVADEKKAESEEAKADESAKAGKKDRAKK